MTSLASAVSLRKALQDSLEIEKRALQLRKKIDDVLLKRSDSILTPQMRKIFNKPLHRRTSNEVEALFEGLCAFNFFYSIPDCSDLVAWEMVPNLELKHFAFDGISIAQQGRPADSFFMVVSGKVKLWIKDTEGHEIILNELHAGDVFGLESLFSIHDPTAVTQWTKNASSARPDTEIIELTRQDYRLCLEPTQAIEARNLSYFLKSLEPFKPISMEKLLQIVLKIRKKNFHANDIVCAQGSPPDEMFIVLKGSCRVLREQVVPRTQLLQSALSAPPIPADKFHRKTVGGNPTKASPHPQRVLSVRSRTPPKSPHPPPWRGAGVPKIHPKVPREAHGSQSASARPQSARTYKPPQQSDYTIHTSRRPLTARVRVRPELEVEVSGDNDDDSSPAALESGKFRTPARERGMTIDESGRMSARRGRSRLVSEMGKMLAWGRDLGDTPQGIPVVVDLGELWRGSVFGEWGINNLAPAFRSCSVVATTACEILEVSKTLLIKTLSADEFDLLQSYGDAATSGEDIGLGIESDLAWEKYRSEYASSIFKESQTRKFYTALN